MQWPVGVATPHAAASTVATMWWLARRSRVPLLPHRAACILAQLLCPRALCRLGPGFCRRACRLRRAQHQCPCPCPCPDGLTPGLAAASAVPRQRLCARWRRRRRIQPAPPHPAAALLLPLSVAQAVRLELGFTAPGGSSGGSSCGSSGGNSGGGSGGGGSGGGGSGGGSSGSGTPLHLGWRCGARWRHTHAAALWRRRVLHQLPLPPLQQLPQPCPAGGVGAAAAAAVAGPCSPDTPASAVAAAAVAAAATAVAPASQQVGRRLPADARNSARLACGAEPIRAPPKPNQHCLSLTSRFSPFAHLSPTPPLWHA